MELRLILCASCGRIGLFDGALVALAAAVVVWTVYAAVRYTVRPGEEDPQHVKRRILIDEDGERP